MNALNAQLIVLAKAPVPGKVKTRLTPPFSPHEAAMLAESALADTLEAGASASFTRHILALADQSAKPQDLTLVKSDVNVVQSRAPQSLCREQHSLGGRVLLWKRGLG